MYKLKYIHLKFNQIVLKSKVLIYIFYKFYEMYLYLLKTNYILKIVKNINNNNKMEVVNFFFCSLDLPNRNSLIEKYLIDQITT